MKTSTRNAFTLRQRLQEHLREDLLSVNEILDRQLKSSGQFITDVTEHVGRFRGKQIRPMLLLLTERMVSDSVTPEGRTLAAAVELIHMATLVHDDIIDDAQTRRHVATVHQRWDPQTAILLGDYLFSRSFHLAASTGDATACQLIGRATDRTCEGELNQIAARLEQSTSEFDYFRIIKGKTGQLFALSCLLGARAAGAAPAQCRAATRFGMRLGLAFQITDDIIDVTQAAATTGKDANNDLKNGRLTLPLIRALRHATSPAELSQLSERIRAALDENRPLQELPFIQNGLSSAGETANELAKRAIRELKYFQDGTDSLLLEAVARFSTQRTD